MQLNIYVPKEKEGLLAQLDAVSKERGKPKNEIVIDAIERYFRLVVVSAELGKYAMGETGLLSRRDIYDGRPKSS